MLKFALLCLVSRVSCMYVFVAGRSVASRDLSIIQGSRAAISLCKCIFNLAKLYSSAALPKAVLRHI